MAGSAALIAEVAPVTLLPDVEKRALWRRFASALSCFGSSVISGPLKPPPPPRASTTSTSGYQSEYQFSTNYFNFHTIRTKLLNCVPRPPVPLLALQREGCERSSSSWKGPHLPTVSYTVAIEEKLAARLSSKAAESKKAVEVLIAECVALQIDAAAKFLFLIERMDLVDQGLIDIALFVGEVTAEVASARSPDDLSKSP